MNSGDTWTFLRGAGRSGTDARNPLHLTDQSAKDLKSRLEWAARRLGHQRAHAARRARRVPLRRQDCVPTLDDVQSTRVYGRDERSRGSHGSGATCWPARRSGSSSASPRSSRTAAAAAVKRSASGLRRPTCSFGDDWKLDPTTCSTPARPGRTGSPSGAGLVRESGSGADLPHRAAGHRGAAASRWSGPRAASTRCCRASLTAASPRPCRSGSTKAVPAILFRHESSDLRLDSYLAVHGETAHPRDCGLTWCGSSPRPCSTPTSARSTTVPCRHGRCTLRRRRTAPSGAADHRLAGRGA